MHSKKSRYSVLYTLLIFLLSTADVWAATRPIPGVGVVVKKNPGNTTRTLTTDKDGNFSTTLDTGNYTLILSQNSLNTAMQGLLASNYPNSRFVFNGNGAEVALTSLLNLNVSTTASGDRLYALDNPASTLEFSVNKDATPFGGKIQWNDKALAAYNECGCSPAFTYGATTQVSEACANVPSFLAATDILNLPIVQLPLASGGSVFYKAQLKLVLIENVVYYELFSATQIQVVGAGFPTYIASTGVLTIPSLYAQTATGTAHNKLTLTLVPNSTPYLFKLNTSEPGGCQTCAASPKSLDML